jgi:hypothetical protein
MFVVRLQNDCRQSGQQHADKPTDPAAFFLFFALFPFRHIRFVSPLDGGARSVTIPKTPTA